MSGPVRSGPIQSSGGASVAFSARTNYKQEDNAPLVELPMINQQLSLEVCFATSSSVNSFSGVAMMIAAS